MPEIPAKANREQALVGTLGSTATILTCFRIYVRWKQAQLKWDDVFNVFALAFLLIFYILGLPCLPLTVHPTTIMYWQVDFAGDVILWATLYLVKASFLALSWRVFNICRTFRRFWWATTIYTFLSYWPILLSAVWQCGDPSKYDDPAVCLEYNQSDSSKWLIWGAVCTALHVSSDCLILALPMFFINMLQIPKMQKLSCASVFALISVDIAMGLIRNTIAACASLNTIGDALLTASDVMQVFEPGLAVIVCALPAYEVFLPNRRGGWKQRSPKRTPVSKSSWPSSSSQPPSLGQESPSPQ